MYPVLAQACIKFAEISNEAAMCYYVFEKDGLLHHQSGVHVFKTYEEGLKCFRELKDNFMDEIFDFVDMVCEEEYERGHIVIGDGEDRYELILSRSVE